MDFDTKEIREHFAHKDCSGPTGTVGPGRTASLGTNKWQDAIPHAERMDRRGADVGVRPDPEDGPAGVLFPRRQAHRFHHTSMVAGGDVIGAGEWIVRKGKLWKVMARTAATIGPRWTSSIGPCSMFRPSRRTPTVFLYDNVDDQWIDYPIRLFISQPTRGGRYQTHPDAVMK